MLLELRIENLLLIERAELRFGPGLNAITGETGAGKTVLAHSLDLLMGGRARSQIVRPGAGEAYVEGVFAVPSGLLDEPELAELAERLPDGAAELVLGRRVGASGRTSAFVQRRSASAADLQVLGGRLVSFYGQYQHRRLTLASAQLEVLDGFAGDEHLHRRGEYRALHAQATRDAAELAELREREGVRERDLDLLRYELSEIEAAAPDPDEAAELGAERRRLQHLDRLRLAAGGALEAFAGVDQQGAGASSLLAAADGALTGVDGVDPKLDGLATRARTVAVELDDLASELRAYLDGIDAEPGRLEAVEERLAAFERLERKHGGSIAAVLAHAERCRTEVARLERADEIGGELEERLAQVRRRRAALAAELGEARREAAGRLQERVESELSQLAMEGARLEVALRPLGEHGGDFGPNGTEAAEMLVATNPGMPLAPLRDAASGGELSRVMLALSGLGPGAGAHTLVFDEIDAGIGGATARAVGERLRCIADPQDTGRQLICITHLPQVASLADTHFRISKRTRGGRSEALVARVEGEELVDEIVRMLGGGASEGAATRHARELLAA